MRSTALAFVCLTVIAGSVACTRVTETDTAYVDEGIACISGEPDAPHRVTVEFPTCLSSSCDTLLEAVCRAELVGERLSITATVKVRSQSGTCSTDCGQVQASCETPPLAAGGYELVYGGVQGVLSVPGVAGGGATCVGE